MRILVGCEYSGTVREAFRKLDARHQVYSCDLLPSDDNSPFHIVGDVRDIIENHGPWDLIIIHPPCTALAVSGNRHYGAGKPKHSERVKAVEWTKELYQLACNNSPRVCMENPVGVLGSMGGLYPTQYIQPFEHGHPETKKTGLWLHGLEPLKPTNDVKAEFDSLPRSEAHRIHYLPPTEDRWKIRSKTYNGIALAMATQWG